MFDLSFQEIAERINNIDPVKYARTRNFLNGDVTYLSPFISRGVITPRHILKTVLSKGYKPYQVEKFIQELAWREYFQRVWQSKGDLICADLKQPQPDVIHHRMISSIEQCDTGIHAIDEQVKQLYMSGYMHNHARMYVASLACNIGKAHWSQPARWLYYHLLDGDIASNTCSWQWVAGAFSSKKYYCNQENINKYTGSGQRNTFLDRPYEDLVTMEVPQVLQATSIPDLSTPLPATPPLSIDNSRPTLVYNSYNLDPLWRRDLDANKLLLLEPSHFTAFPVDGKVISFILEMAKNIPGVMIHVGEFDDIADLYHHDPASVIFKEHPAFRHYRGTMDERDWMFPSVTGYYPSFFSYWKKCERLLGKTE
jgi:deoxyribodipyrimidine photo-lyase